VTRFPEPGINPQDAVSDLKAGLRAIGLTRDVILVSHSLAGEIATYLARSAKWVAAGVLVDASLPNLYTDSFIAKEIKENEETIEEVKKEVRLAKFAINFLFSQPGRS